MDGNLAQWKHNIIFGRKAQRSFCSGAKRFSNVPDAYSELSQASTSTSRFTRISLYHFAPSLTAFLRYCTQKRIWNTIKYLKWKILEKQLPAESGQEFLQKTPSQIFEWVPNTPLCTVK